MPTYKQGDIVIVEVPDPGGGNPKERPVIILTRTEEIDTAPVLLGVAISTSLDDPLPRQHVLLPYRTPRHPVTGLTKKAAAKCDWRPTFQKSQIVRRIGELPARLMIVVMWEVISLLHPPM